MFTETQGKRDFLQCQLSQLLFFNAQGKRNGLAGSPSSTVVLQSIGIGVDFWWCFLDFSFLCYFFCGCRDISINAGLMVA